MFKQGPWSGAFVDEEEGDEPSAEEIAALQAASERNFAHRETWGKEEKDRRYRAMR